MKSTFFFYKNCTRLVFNASPLIAKPNAEKLKGLLNLFTCFFANHPRFQVMLVMRKIEVWKLIWYKESKLSDNLSLTVTIYKKIPLTTASSIRIFLSIEGKWVFSPLLIDPQLLNSFLWQTQNCQLNEWNLHIRQHLFGSKKDWKQIKWKNKTLQSQRDRSSILFCIYTLTLSTNMNAF